MIVIISRLSHFCYAKIAKPLLFRVPPDAVHARTISLGKRVQKNRFITTVLSTMWSYQNPAILSQTIKGLTFRNPVGLSAGFDKNFQLPPLMKAVGFGFMEGGSLTYRSYNGNLRPWFHRLPKTKAIVVNAGLANHGVAHIIPRIKKYPRAMFDDFPLNVSIAKTNSPHACTTATAIVDYIKSLTALEKANIGQLYTLNISCPNTFGGQPFTTPDLLEQLLSVVDDLKIKKPVFIKMPAHLPWKEFKKLTDVAKKHRIDGLIISNLIYREQAVLKDPLSDSVKGKLGGAANTLIANDLIYRTRAHYKDRFVIIGVGGIFTAADAYEKIKCGANLVALITSLIYEGPALVGQINRDLVDLLHRDGYSHIHDAIGAYHK